MIAGAKEILLVVLLMTVVFLTGCVVFDDEDKAENIQYDLCDETMIPDELFTVIQNKKDKPFKLTYSNNTYTYLVVCEGKLDRDDVYVDVVEVKRTSSAIYVETVLRREQTDPKGNFDISGAEKKESISFPYIVIRIPKLKLPVIFR